jgi:hypothetical protein
MTPAKYELLVDHFDKSITDPENPGVPLLLREDAFLSDHLSLSDDLETNREWQILNLAFSAIRYHAISQEVQTVRIDLQSRTLGAIPIQRAPLSDSRIPGTAFRATTTPIVRRLVTNSMKIAAILIFVISLAGMGKYIFTRPSGFYDKYYSSYELGTTRGDNSPDRLQQAYQAADWASVVNNFQSKTQKTATDYFLTAMACMEQKKYYNAIGLFKTLISSNSQLKEPYFQDEAEYYLAMSYLATNQTSLAISLFDKIKADPEHLFNKQVRRMSGIDMLILRAK